MGFGSSPRAGTLQSGRPGVGGPNIPSSIPSLISPGPFGDAGYSLDSDRFPLQAYPFSGGVISPTCSLLESSMRQAAHVATLAQQYPSSVVTLAGVVTAPLEADSPHRSATARTRASRVGRANAAASVAAGAVVKPKQLPRPRARPAAAGELPRWPAPLRSKDRPLQGNAKSNATVLLTGCRHDISVNSLLLEDNALFEGMVPARVTASGLTLAHPPRLFLGATLLCLLEGVPDEELVNKWGLTDIVRMRKGHPLDKSAMKRLFPRRKKGTTKYELCPGIRQLFEERSVAWPAFVISDDDAAYLMRKYSK